VLADIFLGKITKWNDEKIAKLNAGVKLPDTAILVAHRSDGSGTSNIFTDFLSKVSPEWKVKVGTGPAVNWPTGLGGKGNEGVTGLIKQTPGAIGYVELIYAESNKLPVAMIRNKAGTFVSPSPKSVTAAAQGSIKSMPEDMRVSVTNADGKDSYPISGYTYLIVSKDMKAAGAKGKAMVKFLKWAMGAGQKMAEPLSYAALPLPLVKKVEAKIASIQTE
jgi:phosphate transport system substrate-binding protein